MLPGTWHKMPLNLALVSVALVYTYINSFSGTWLFRLLLFVVAVMFIFVSISKVIG